MSFAERVSAGQAWLGSLWTLQVLAVSVARETVARGSYHPRTVEDPARPPIQDALDRECRHRFLLLLADAGVSDLGTA
jgi:hypothetical protein